MRLKATFLLTLWLCFTQAAFAQNSTSIEFLGKAFPVESSEALEHLLEAEDGLADPITIWHEAVGIGRSELAEEAAGRAAIVRLMEAAVIRGGGASESLPLDQLSRSDLNAIKEAIGFPGDDDLVNFLFARAPSLRDEFEFENYAIVRIILPELDTHLIRERADRPYLGLMPSFSEQYMPVADDPVQVAIGERARTRRLNLAAIGDIIVAAKAFRAASRVEGNARLYPLLIAADALERAFRANPKDFRLVAYRAHWHTLQALRNSPQIDQFINQEVRRLEFAIPRSAFFARQFSDAEEAYRLAPVPQGDLRGQLWSSWGQTVSVFARNADASSLSAKTSELLSPETLDYARMFHLLLSHLHPLDRYSLAGVTDWENELNSLLEGRPTISKNREWLAFNQDFLRILETIGRPDIAARYLMDEIGHIDRNTPDAFRELQMLTWLAPFISDYCYQISFEMSPASGWRLREVGNYNRYLDFLHSIDASGEVVEPGEIVQILNAPGPYGATSPEEDCATTLAVYGIASSDLFGLSEATSSADAANIISGIESWVLASLERTDPSPSAVPYLKLIWIEWFSQAFQPLTVPGTTPERYSYNAINASSLTSKEAVTALLAHDAINPYDRKILQLFLLTRSFLEVRYP